MTQESITARKIEKKPTNFQVFVGLVGLAAIAWGAGYLAMHWGDTKVNVHAFKCDEVTLSNCVELKNSVTVSAKDSAGNIVKSGETGKSFWIDEHDQGVASITVMTGFDQLNVVVGEQDTNCTEYEEKTTYLDESGETVKSTLVRRTCQGGDASTNPDITIHLAGSSIKQTQSIYPWQEISAELIYTEQQ